MTPTVSTAIDQLARTKIVPVVVLDDPSQAEPLAEALVAGGLPVAEVTFRTPAAAAGIALMAARGDILVGAGTVLSPDQADRAAAAGASYIVSPGTSLPVIRRCRELGVEVLPGAVTATEIQGLLELGVSVVKFFPAGTSGGPAAIEALAAPFAGVSFVPTGGVGPANLRDYLRLPAVAAVGGSWMVPPALIRAGRYDDISELCARAVALAAKE